MALSVVDAELLGLDSASTLSVSWNGTVYSYNNTEVDMTVPGGRNASSLFCEAPFPTCKDPWAPPGCSYTWPEYDVLEFPPNTNISSWEECEASGMIGDGKCDPSFNVEVCQFDKGDCCPQTCVYTYLPGSCKRFQCLDPHPGVARLDPPPQLAGTQVHYHLWHQHVALA